MKLEKNKLLIIEDSLTQAKQLESMLSTLGFDTALAYSGKEALDYLKANKPALVISDILMPEMDGFELCKTIKTNPKTRDITVVLLTQLSDPKEIIRGLECGADDFIVKPYNDDLLLARIRAIIAIRLEQASSERQSSILIAEDSPTQAEQLKFLLEENGYAVTTAPDGKQALEAARQLKPTLIISDILMPVMNGYELAREIKKDESLKKTPIILITSLTDRRELVANASIVADGYFTKPYDEKYLLNKIQALLSSEYTESGPAGPEPLEIMFAGEKYKITAGRRQILTFLLSTYENAVQQNQDLILMQRELQISNEQLEERVAERTHQLQASEAKYRIMLENNADAILVIGPDNTVYFANQAALDLFGSRSEELIGSHFDFPVTVGDIKDIEIANRGGDTATAEIRVVETTWGDERARLATLRDVTGRKRMEQALRESEENFRALAENANEGIFITMGEDRHVYSNRRAAQITGYTVQEILNNGLGELSRRSGEAGAAEGATKKGHYETTLSHKELGSIAVELTASDSAWQGQPATIIIFRDITERKRREEDIIRASKLESLGTLAGGIAHDFNNLLTGIIGNVSLAKLLMNNDDRAFKILEDLEKASLRAKDLTKQLLTFSKGGAPVKKAASIAELIRESASFIVRGTNIKCVFDLPADLYTIEVDEGQMSQVIHNLIINSVQAMAAGGVIKISAGNCHIDGSNPTLKKGEYIKISVRDTGHGIGEETLSRIFDPYFTTKAEGSGLGLATVYSIIKNHEGYITVESEVGGGTTFVIFLPALPSQKRRDACAPVKIDEDRAVFGKGRILLMDDEEIVREAAGEILTELGYEVAFARDGMEALDLYKDARACGRPFSMIIMDLTIPGGMGGKEAIKKLLEIDPGVKAIVSSGYSADSIMSDYKKYGFSAVIAKPYRVSDLSKTVDSVLNTRQ